jgi:NADH-quinone oxidoreductase subunit A
MDLATEQSRLWPLAVYFGAVVALAAFMLVSSFVLGERSRREGRQQEPYESGIKPTGSAWMHFDVKYYLIAMFFVIFDVETIFVYAWAVSLKSAGWPGLTVMTLFIGVLLAALVYLWRVGALDWAVPNREKGETGGRADS